LQDQQQIPHERSPNKLKINKSQISEIFENNFEFNFDLKHNLF